MMGPMPKLKYTGGRSNAYGADEAERWLAEPALANIEYVVDFGMGVGMMGAIVRRAMPFVHITGVDLYPAPKRAQVYNEVVLADVYQHARSTKIRPHTLWVFGDVLEHLPKANAMQLLNDPRPAAILIRIPVGPAPQPPQPDNPHEEHLWTFYPTDFQTVSRRVVRSLTKSRRKSRPDFTDLSRRPEYGTPNSYVGNYLLM